MRTSVRWLGIAAFLLVSATAAADDPLKPYVVMMLDTSGSMVNTPGAVTGSGPPSCGGADLRLNHARCAINKIVNSYGDMVFALGRFRETSGGTYSSSCDANGNGQGGGADQCTTSGVACGACSCNGRTENCSACSSSLYDDARGEMLTGLVDGGNQSAATWTDFSCASCGGQGTSLASQPEIWGAGSWTPLGGYLASASRYWRGLQATDNSVIWPSASPGFDPIRNDPTKTVFVPNGCDPNPTTCGATNNCCDTQCRPYITIMLTDGAETCGGNAVPVATSMLNTVIDNREYRIETKVIGFGITPGDPDIEAYAQAGGAPDLPGANEGFYANDEASLQLALSEILAGAVKVETCNNQDDDCDGDIDEDFVPPASVPGKGGACNNGQLGICARTGALQCRSDGAGLECNAQTVTPGVEALPCNGLDDDCDGRIDENLGCTQCIPTGEICDTLDNDCDGVVNQVCRCSNNMNVRCDGNEDCSGGACDCAPLTRQCGTGSCVGIETCTAPNTYTGCDAQLPDPNGEACNGVDDDCDGLCDGFTEECSDFLTPNGPGTDSPGHPQHMPVPIAQNICRPGLKTCALGCTAGPKDFGACSGEILPCNGQPNCIDPCNGIDDDCDNTIDEDFATADCSTNCGLGATVCQNGTIVCNSVMQGVDNTCNGQDEDCDNKFDEHWGELVGNPPVKCQNDDSDETMCDPCTMDGAGDPVCDGITKCIAGVPTCEGGPVGTEVCNCEDDDCDDKIDEDPQPGNANVNICPGVSACVECQCAFQCTNEEFPCPLGKRCDTSDRCSASSTTPSKECLVAGDCPGGTCDDAAFCVNDPCFNVTCGPVNGNLQTCIPDPAFPNQSLCVETCSLINNLDQMDGYPSCPQGANPQICFGPAGECRPDTCQTFPERCAANENCIAGSCIVNPCDGVTCDGATYCVGGECVSSCGDVTCPSGQRCRMGACEEDPCEKQCPFGQACNDSTGECIEDPCKFRECPVGQWCNPNDGQCAEDPCVSSEIACPNAGEVCRGGSCLDPNDLGPDAAPGSFVTVGGGGCSTGDSGGWLIALGALGLLLSRRRRTVGGAL